MKPIAPRRTSTANNPGIADLWIVFCASCVIAIYLATTILASPAAHSAESSDRAPRIPQSKSTAADKPSPPATLVAPWVARGESVPPWTLYSEENPAPAFEAKHQSWHNRILFPSVQCPYCGRRVPTQKGSYIFLLIGFIGQLGFSGRFLVQWIASERARASVIPVSFWYLSIVGSLLLLAYAISIMAWPIILGQAPNVLIYGRNLYFLKQKQDATEDAPQPPADNAQDSNESA